MENYKWLLIGSEPRLLRKYNGYYYRVGDVPAITILGNFCGLRDLGDYTQDEQLRKTMDTADETEKQGGKIVKRTGFVTADIDWSVCRQAGLPLSLLSCLRKRSISASSFATRSSGSAHLCITASRASFRLSMMPKYLFAVSFSILAIFVLSFSFSAINV
ncbi:MAG: hypothetical protein LBD85_01520 [Oscillospiraceae bacterium]|nr:hypothetical protein [Oscillospiraceae bacterium]